MIEDRGANPFRFLPSSAFDLATGLSVPDKVFFFSDSTLSLFLFVLSPAIQRCGVV
jgi:hypothetical protein